jgi:uncharacterized membrane protein
MVQQAMVFHLFGVISWIAGLVAVATLLRLHAREASQGIIDVARKAAMLTDIAATVAIGTGLWMIMGLSGTPMSPMKNRNIQIKVTLAILVVVGMHGLIRAKLGKARKGKEGSALPDFVLPVLLGTAFVIVYLAVRRPF